MSIPSFHLPLTLHIACTWLSFRARHKFASAVALLSTLGIMIGVGALIIVTAVMQGLERRLQDTLLQEHYHVLAWCSPDTVDTLLKQGLIEAYVPCIAGRALLLTAGEVHLVEVYGIDSQRLTGNSSQTQARSASYSSLKPGAYQLIADRRLTTSSTLPGQASVQLLSLAHLRYGPMGPMPRQRRFTIAAHTLGAAAGTLPGVTGHYADVQALLAEQPAPSYRLYLRDPTQLQPILQVLQGQKVQTWREHLGEFLQAVALEKVTMSLMLCLIIVVAAFNILSAISMMVGSRLQDIAILKTLGLRNHHLLAVFLLMGLGCALTGTTAGTAAGVTLALWINELLAIMGISILSPGQSIPVEIAPGTVLSIALFAIILTCLCALYPACRAARAPVLNNLVKVS